MQFSLPAVCFACLLLASCAPSELPTPAPTHPAFPFTPIALTATPVRTRALPTPTPADGVPRIVVGDNFFEAPRVVITAGGTVEWVHVGSATHTATSADGKWPVIFLTPGTHARQTFDLPGTYRYFCSYHPGMIGVIEVVP